MSALPTQKLQITDINSAVDEIKAFGAELASKGERPWFEVRYPAPPHLGERESKRWLERQELSFDAVEIVDGNIVTLPPYAVLEAAAS